MTRLEGSLPNVEYGLAEVRDYGGSEYDPDSQDEPWKLDVPITSNSSSVTEAISSLSAEGGGDPPEAYGRALWETDTNPNVGWRPGARHLIVLVCDQVPHNPNVDEGIPEEFWVEPSPWNTGEELQGTWGIPGTELKEGEKLDFHEVLRQLARDGKPLEMVDYHDTEGDFIHYWEHWAALAGGTAIEANEGGKELAGKLIPLVEKAPEDTACATAAVPLRASPSSAGGLPTALTPRFLQPGSAFTFTPAAGKEFCGGQQPALGGAFVGELEQDTSSTMSFRVPPTASSGLSLTDLSGALWPSQPFEVDNFRYPWGFNIINSSGRGEGTYDSNAGIITQADVEAVFHLSTAHSADVDLRDSAVYKEAEEDAQQVLAKGLCYGFTMLSWELYVDAHGQSQPLGWADSPGFSLSAGEWPYALMESESGPHGLTRALLRAAVSQFSPEVQATWEPVTSVASLEEIVKPAFAKGQPVPVLIHFDDEGHAMLAFNYQKTSSGGVDMDVVDPNVPFGEAPYQRGEVEAYPRLQVKVNADGSWEFLGSFGNGTFGNLVGGASGSLEVVPKPLPPGGLLLPSSSPSADGFTYIHPATGDAVSAISYSGHIGRGIPSDATPELLFDDAPENRLVVPSQHRVVTVTMDPAAGLDARASVGVSLTGFGFIDTADLAGSQHTVTVRVQTGSLGVALAGDGTTLSVTRVIDGTQRTVDARFTGRVQQPLLSVGPAGQVGLTTAGGTGHVSIRLATYTRNGEHASMRPETLRLHGRERVRRHTPKVKRRRHRRHMMKRRGT